MHLQTRKQDLYLRNHLCTCRRISSVLHPITKSRNACIRQLIRVPFIGISTIIDVPEPRLGSSVVHFRVVDFPGRGPQSLIGISGSHSRVLLQRVSRSGRISPVVSTRIPIPSVHVAVSVVPRGPVSGPGTLSVSEIAVSISEIAISVPSVFPIVVVVIVSAVATRPAVVVVVILLVVVIIGWSSSEGSSSSGKVSVSGRLTSRSSSDRRQRGGRRGGGRRSGSSLVESIVPVPVLFRVGTVHFGDEVTDESLLVECREVCAQEVVSRSEKAVMVYLEEEEATRKLFDNSRKQTRISVKL